MPRREKEPFPAKSLRSAEGGGRAVGRLLDYALKFDDPGDVLFTGIPFPVPSGTSTDLSTTWAELIGFWVVWHLTGGFERLEMAGWKRATIYRRIARFKEVFGVHPDEFEFGYVELKPEEAWRAHAE